MTENISNELFPRAAQLRAAGSNALRGSWGKAALCTLVIWAVMLVFCFMLELGGSGSALVMLVAFLAILLVASPLQFGYNVAFLRHVRGEDNADLVTRPFQAFRQYGRYLGTSLLMALFLVLWALIVIPAIFVGSVVAMVAGADLGALASMTGAADPAYLMQSMNLGVVGVIFLLFYIAGFIPAIVMGYAYALTPYVMHDHPELSASECIGLSRQMMKGYKWKLFCLDFSFIGWIVLCVLTLGILSLWVGPHIECSHVKFYEELKARQA